MKELLKAIMTDKQTGIQGAFLKPVLWVLSLIFTGLVVFTRTLHMWGVLPSYRSKRPVISVGNITAGGVGKTPIVMLLVKHLLRQGQCPVVLTRGFMPSDAPGGAVSDEAMMLHESTGVAVLVGADRVVSLRNADQLASADVYILDDGFQQWRLKRDLDIVAIDAAAPFSNGHLFPRGLLREPLPALARADLFILTRTDLGRANVAFIRQRLEAIKPGCPVVETIHAPTGVDDAFDPRRIMDLGALKGKIAAFCGIGSPYAFEQMLVSLGADITQTIAFDDHHHYTREDAQWIAGICHVNKVSTVVTTHKDAVKLRHLKDVFQGLTLLVLKVEIKVVHGETELFSRIDRLRRS